jgi:PKD domain
MSVAFACLCGGGAVLPGAALALPGWTAPVDFPVPANALASTVQIGYQSGGTATLAYLELVSQVPLQTVLHVGVIPPGGSYQEQLRITSSVTSIPTDVTLAEAPDGAAVLEWPVLEGSDPSTSPIAYLASYRAAGAGAWEAPATIATDTTRESGINATLVPAISADGTAAAGVDHLDPTIPSPGGYRIDVAVHPPGGSWGPAAQISPMSDSSEGLALGFDASGNLTAAFRLELPNTRHTLAAARRPASSGIWGSFEDVTGSDPTSDAFGPVLGIAPDGSAVIAFQYVHYASPKTLDVNAVTRAGASAPWTSPVDVAPGGASSGPLAAGVSPDDKAYVLYTLQGMSSGEDCVGVVRAQAGGSPFSGPQCVSPINFQSGYHGGLAFLGNDAYFAWSGAPNGGSSSVAEGSRWVDGATQPDSFTDLDAPGTGIQLNHLIPDEDGSIAAFWTMANTLQAAAFDAGGPNLLSAGVPSSAVVGEPVAMSTSFADLWSGLGGPPSWSFGDGSNGTGAQVSHTYSAPGTYTVTVTADDGLGNQTSVMYPIVVSAILSSPPPPVPLLSVLASKVAGQSVLVRLGCAGGVCDGDAVLTAREKLSSGRPIAVVSHRKKARVSYRTVVVGSTPFTLSPGQTVNDSVTLDATGRKLLKRYGRLPVTLTVTLTVAGKTRTIATSKPLTIAPPKRRHKKH